MKVLDFLDLESINLDIKSTAKKEAISELCDLLVTKGKIKDATAVLNALMEREKLGSTGIGQGVAIPHAKSESASGLVAALGVSKKGIKFDSLDGEPVFIVFLLVSPPDAAGQHLKVLARISRLLKDKFFRQSLKEAKSFDDIQKLIQEEDEY
jgi:nitrogen PTS system EIIA component